MTDSPTRPSKPAAAVDAAITPAGETSTARTSEDGTTIPPVLAPTAPETVSRLVERWLGRRSETTRKAYSKDLMRFADWLGARDSFGAVRALLAAGRISASWKVDEYAQSLVDTGYAPATINRRLAAIKSVVARARKSGLIEWELDVETEKVVPLRDMSGPSVRWLRAMLAVAAAQGGQKALRDVAIVQLAIMLALRRNELATLDVGHYDRRTRMLRVLGKGERQRTAMKVPSSVGMVLEAYLAARGANDEEPMFLNMDRAGKGAGKGRRLSAGGIYRLIRRLGEQALVPARVSPHRVRHSAITHGLNASDGDVRACQAFGRHADPSTTMRYDDERLEPAARISNLLAAAVGTSHLETLGLANADPTRDEPENIRSRAHSNVLEEAADAATSTDRANQNEEVRDEL